jgi:hypothetical protein
MGGVWVKRPVGLGAKGCENMREPLSSGSGSEKSFDLCQQKISAKLLQGPVDWHVKFVFWVASEYPKLELRVMQSW